MNLTYVEPFVGGGNTLERVVKTRKFIRVIANDIHPDLMRMWFALSREGWIPPAYVDKKEHERLKNSGVSSALRGYVGFCCSYRGAFFAGHQDKMWGEGKGGQRIERQNIIRTAQVFRDVEFQNTDYAELCIPPGSIVYCDPPYLGTTGYSSGEFDHKRFWNTMDKWVDGGAIVLVSEYDGPWLIHDEIETYSSLAHTSLNDRRIERLFIRRP
jgi:DNA adenine methylase